MPHGGIFPLGRKKFSTSVFNSLFDPMNCGGIEIFLYQKCTWEFPITIKSQMRSTAQGFNSCTSCSETDIFLQKKGPLDVVI